MSAREELDAFSDEAGSAWTDAEHGAYLDGMEGLFTRGLYARRYCHVDICGAEQGGSGQEEELSEGTAGESEITNVDLDAGSPERSGEEYYKHGPPEKPNSSSRFTYMAPQPEGLTPLSTIPYMPSRPSPFQLPFQYPFAPSGPVCVTFNSWMTPGSSGGDLSSAEGSMLAMNGTDGDGEWEAGWDREREDGQERERQMRRVGRSGESVEGGVAGTREREKREKRPLESIPGVLNSPWIQHWQRRAVNGEGERDEEEGGEEVCEEREGVWDDVWEGREREGRGALMTAVMQKTPGRTEEHYAGWYMHKRQKTLKQEILEAQEKLEKEFEVEERDRGVPSNPNSSSDCDSDRRHPFSYKERRVPPSGSPFHEQPSQSQKRRRKVGGEGEEQRLKGRSGNDDFEDKNTSNRQTNRRHFQLCRQTWNCSPGPPEIEPGCVERSGGGATKEGSCGRQRTASPRDQTVPCIFESCPASKSSEPSALNISLSPNPSFCDPPPPPTLISRPSPLGRSSFESVASDVPCASLNGIPFRNSNSSSDGSQKLSPVAAYLQAAENELSREQGARKGGRMDEKRGRKQERNNVLGLQKYPRCSLEIKNKS